MTVVVVTVQSQKVKMNTTQMTFTKKKDFFGVSVTAISFMFTRKNCCFIIFLMFFAGGMILFSVVLNSFVSYYYYYYCLLSFFVAYHLFDISGACHNVQLLLCRIVWARSSTEIRRH